MTTVMGSEDAALSGHAAGAAAEQVLEAGGGLVEQALVLERLSEDDVEHTAMARMRDVREPRPPMLHERAKMLRVIFEDVPVDAGVGLLPRLRRLGQRQRPRRTRQRRREIGQRVL